MIAIIDYGAGNLGSVYKAFRYIGTDAQVTNDPKDVDRADALVLPGVGAFTHCMVGLSGVHLTDATKEFIASGRPFLGICVGMQMLFEASEEMGDSPGLGELAGRVVRFNFDDRQLTTDDAHRFAGLIGEKSCGSNDLNDVGSPSSVVGRLKIPHIGWNQLNFKPNAALFVGLEQGVRVYFVHSYFPEPTDAEIVSATSDYGRPFCCAVERGNVHATQFHPEKSGAVGLRILRNFADLAA